MAYVRPPAVAGLFYPADADALRAHVLRLLEDARRTTGAGAEARTERPLALVSPHAAYTYSGPVAGSAYAALGTRPAGIRRVILLGPAHFVPVRGVALPAASAFATPLGEVPVDEESAARALRLPGVEADDRVHAREHSLEVQLPFLQSVLTEGFTVLPLAVGHVPDERVARLLELLWDDDETLVVVSTDLSHYLTYAEAARRDARTAEAIGALDAGALGPGDACGVVPLRSLLRVARTRGLRCRRLDLRSSGDTAGSLGRVVGYGAFALERAKERPTAVQR
jgi:AmmeMemoRadiSam system protein B